MFMKRSVMAILVPIALFCADTAVAQPPAPRLEVAAQMNMLRFSDFRFGTPIGIGGRLSYEVTSWLTVEGEVDYFPSDKIAFPEGMTSIGSVRLVHFRRRTDALAGVKVGTRGERLGAFIKARPGVTRLAHKGITCLGPGCALILLSAVPPKYRTEFAFDFGGGMEFYAGHRLVARAEIGDTVIRHDSAVIPCPNSVCTTHNLSTRFGIGYRF
jgi:hypothetical protein